MIDFNSFWLAYPRKVAKAAALKAWSKLSPEQQQTALKAMPQHCEYWKQCQTEKEYIPHASTWLNGWRFDDEIELPKPKVIEPSWWTSEAGIMAKAKELGMSIRPGESWFELKNRINDQIRKSA